MDTTFFYARLQSKPSISGATGGVGRPASPFGDAHPYRLGETRSWFPLLLSTKSSLLPPTRLPRANPRCGHLPRSSSPTASQQFLANSRMDKRPLDQRRAVRKPPNRGAASRKVSDHVCRWYDVRWHRFRVHRFLRRVLSNPDSGPDSYPQRLPLLV